MRAREFITEVFDNPLAFNAQWDEEDVPEDEIEDYDGQLTYPSRIQTVDFTSPDGIPYLWYAKQNKYDDTAWEIVFGAKTGKTFRGNDKIDIGKTGTGNQMRIFATVLDITDEFVEYFEYEVRNLYFTADKDDGMSRQKLYKKILQHRMPDGFALGGAEDRGDEVHFTLNRIY